MKPISLWLGSANMLALDRLSHPKDRQARMLEVQSPTALAAMTSAGAPIAKRPTYDSVMADKFVLRLSPALKSGLRGLSQQHGRSLNSEAGSAVLASLAGRVRETAMRNILVGQLGKHNAARVLLQVERFNEVDRKPTEKTIVRLPEGVRWRVTCVVTQFSDRTGGAQSMHSWMINALVWWVNIHYEIDALLTASIAKAPEVAIMAD